MAGCLENNGALMRRAESFLTHVRCKYMWAAYTRSFPASISLPLPLFLSLAHSVRLHIHIRDKFDLFSESLAEAYVASHISAQDTRAQSCTESREIIKLYADIAFNVMTLSSRKQRDGRV